MKDLGMLLDEGPWAAIGRRILGSYWMKDHGPLLDEGPWAAIE